MEPWDGPAAVAFTDGRADRRDARPQRPAPRPLAGDQGRLGRSSARRPACSTSRPANIARKGRLAPGKLFLVDLEQGRIVPDERDQGARSRTASRTATGTAQGVVHLDDLPERDAAASPRAEPLRARQRAFG